MENKNKLSMLELYGLFHNYLYSNNGVKEVELGKGVDIGESTVRLYYKENRIMSYTKPLSITFFITSKRLQSVFCFTVDSGFYSSSSKLILFICHLYEKELISCGNSILDILEKVTTYRINLADKLYILEELLNTLDYDKEAMLANETAYNYSISNTLDMLTSILSDGFDFSNINKSTVIKLGVSYIKLSRGTDSLKVGYYTPTMFNQTTGVREMKLKTVQVLDMPNIIGETEGKWLNNVLSSHDYNSIDTIDLGFNFIELVSLIDSYWMQSIYDIVSNLAIKGLEKGNNKCS